MNSVVFFAFLVADISALMIPNVSNSAVVEERLIGSSIEKAIQAISQGIKDAGLDPLHIKKVYIKKALPVPNIFNAEFIIEDIISHGISNIVVHKVYYNLITSQLNFDIELPLIDFSIGAASAQVTLLGKSLDVKASGKVAIHRIRIIGYARIHIGLAGITVRRIDITLTFKNITSNINLVIQGKDFSNKANKFIGCKVPGTLRAYSSEINELLDIVILDFINAKLKFL